MVESRRQVPGESGAQYALEKARLCRRCPIQLAEADIVPYLLRGLLRPEHASVLMNPVPPDVATFIDTIRRLEAISGVVPVPTPQIQHLPAPMVPPPASTSPLTLNLVQVLEKVSSSMERFERYIESSMKETDKKVTFSSRPGTPSAPRRDPSGSLVSYNCQGLGHISRFCPLPDRRTQQNPAQGNGPAGLPGQGQH